MEYIRVFAFCMLEIYENLKLMDIYNFLRKKSLAYSWWSIQKTFSAWSTLHWEKLNSIHIFAIHIRSIKYTIKFQYLRYFRLNLWTQICHYSIYWQFGWKPIICVDKNLRKRVICVRLKKVANLWINLPTRILVRQFAQFWYYFEIR